MAKLCYFRQYPTFFLNVEITSKIYCGGGGVLELVTALCRQTACPHGRKNEGKEIRQNPSQIIHIHR
jgi:hypothetical protein